MALPKLICKRALFNCLKENCFYKYINVKETGQNDFQVHMIWEILNIELISVVKDSLSVSV